MSVRPDPRSPWGARLWIRSTDFDPRMEEVLALAPAAQFKPGRGIDVDVVLLQAYAIDPDFVDLPDACVGRTVFEADGRYKVEVARGLADEAERSAPARRRLRSTLAHECAHVALHSVLHPIGAGPSLFEEMASPGPAVMCREPSLDGAASGQWWEIQANKGMASLLMPRQIVGEQLRMWLASKGLESVEAAFAARRGEALVRVLSELFDVNLPVAFYRLRDLGFVPRDVGQTTLVLEGE